MEPMPEAVGPLIEAMASGLRIHKLILMDTTDAINRVRPDVERLVGAAATFTQVPVIYYMRGRWSCCFRSIFSDCRIRD